MFSRNSYFLNQLHATDVVKVPKRVTLRESLTHFISNFTLPCYHYLVEITLTSYERVLWFIVHLIGATAVGLMVRWSLNQHQMNPFVTTLYDTAYPINEIGFPAVYICPNNIISRRRAQVYAQYLASVDKNGRDVEFFLEGIRHFGKLFDFDATEPFGYVNFNRILEELDTNFNVSARVENLIPQCDDLLIRCLWRGNVLNCSDGKAFIQGLSETGPCCVFNHKRAFSQNLTSATYGLNSGLVLYINTSTNDYFFPLEPYVGVRVMLLNPGSRSDQSIGRIAALIPSGTETLAKIDAIIMKSDSNVERYPIAKRRCRFDDDTEVKHKINPYIRANCVHACRVESIMTLCRCIPLHYDDIIQKGEIEVKVCSLEHLPCLSRFSDKWVTPIFTEDRQPGVENEFETGLSCVECIPPCIQTKFSISTTRLPLRKLPAVATMGSSRLRNIKNLNEVILLKVFYGKPDNFMYRQYISKNWFEALSDMGGLSGVLIGFSFLSVAEVGYFILVRTIILIKNRQQTKTNVIRRRYFHFYR